MQPSGSSWVTPNADAAAPVPRLATVTLPAAPRPPFSDPLKTSTVLQPLPSHPDSTSSSMLPQPPAVQAPSMLPRFGVPAAAVAPAVRSATGDGTETITVTNVVSAPAINKLGSLFNSLNKTVTGALNTFIAQQQQQPQSAEPWQPVGQQFDQHHQQLQQQHLQHLQQTALTITPVQRFPTTPVPQALPFTQATAVVPSQPQPRPPQQPTGAPRLPSNASSAFVRVGSTVDSQTRFDAFPSQQRPAPEHHHAVPPPAQHIQQPSAGPPHLMQPQHVVNAGEIYRELPYNHVEPRMHLAPAGRGK